MEKYYYLVPLYNNHVQINGIPFDYLLEYASLKIKELEYKKDVLLENHNYKEFQKLYKNISEMYKILAVPRYVVLVEENNIFHEMVTNGIITCDDYGELFQYAASYSMVQEYCSENNYKDRFLNLYYSFLNYKDSSKYVMKKR